MFRIILLSTLLIISFSACGLFGPSEDKIESFFEVTISGDITTQFEGSSTFGASINPITGKWETIIILVADDDFEKAVNIAGLTIEEVRVHTYPIIQSLPGESFDSLSDNTFAAAYFPGDDRYSETFQSQSGSITFSGIDANILEGSFTFQAKGRLLSNNETGGGSDVFITVEGQFRSVRGIVL